MTTETQPKELIDLYGFGPRSHPELLVERLGVSLQRAREIIRAVNSHDELLDAVKAARNLIVGANAVLADNPRAGIVLAQLLEAKMKAERSL